MSRDGNGTYTAPVNSWNPAINGVLATAGDYQALLNDIVAALTQSVSRDGQSPMTGSLNMGNNKISGLTAGTGTGQALAFEQLFSQGVMADLASAATTDIGAQNTNFLRITGNTTITSFGSNFRGPRFLVFEGAVTLTNSSTLVLPGNANITTAAGDVLIAIPGATLGTADKWIVAAYQAATGYLKSNNPSYTGTLTGGTGVVNLGSGQFYKDASGNVGIGTSSPGRPLHVASSSTSYLARFQNSGSALALINFKDSTTGDFDVGVGASGASLVAYTGNLERARIDSSGNLLVGTTSNSEGSRLFVRYPSATSGGAAVIGTEVDSTATLRALAFRNPNGLVGTVSTSGSSTAYNTSSDYRLKENVQPMTGALAKVAALKPVNYKWKVDGSDGQGFIAHELAEVFPDAVTGEKDAVDAEGNPQYQGIDTSFLVATLTAAIQEQQAIILAQESALNALTARVAALEAA